MKMNKFKITTLLLSTLLLASCDGSGASDSPTDSGNPDTTDTQLKSTGVLSIPVITSVSSINSKEVNISWKPSQYTSELDNSITYSIHIKKGSSDFVPDENTEHMKSIDSGETKITFLEKDTEYSIKVIAKNGSDQSISTAYIAKTSDIDAVVKSGLKIHYQKDIKISILGALADDGTVLDPSDGIKLGDILYDDESGFVLKVTSIDSNNIAQFRQVSIRDMFERVSVGITN
jgi:hypothetical protein